MTLAFASIYVWYPSKDIIVSLALICGCFIYISANLVYHLWNQAQIDVDLPLKKVLTKELSLLDALERRNKHFFSVIFATSFLGGFLLGLIARVWTIDQMITKPILILLILVLTGFAYWVSGKSSFRTLNSILSKNYRVRKMALKEQLSFLEEEE